MQMPCNILFQPTWTYAKKKIITVGLLPNKHYNGHHKATEKEEAQRTPKRRD